jgi:two-component system LytT family response regulator
MNKNGIEILIVDDEASSRGVLNKLLQDIVFVPFSIKEAKNVDEALMELRHNNIDILFLDVQMPEQTGLDLLKQLDTISFEIIFVTGYDKYAIHAFRFNAIDYLLKPVEIDELRTAVTRALSRVAQKKNSSLNIAHLLPVLDGNANGKKVAVHVGEKVVFVDVANISHIVASDNYSEITTAEKRKFVTPRVLKEFELYLQPIPFFIRINRGVIINTNCIQSYSKDFPCIVDLKTGFSFEISRRKKAEVMKLLQTL